MEKNTIFHQNYEEDFLYVFRFAGGIPSYPWKLVFNTYVGLRKSIDSYVASFNGDTFTNCRIVTGTSDTILVQFDNHYLPPGDLCFRLFRWVSNDLFDDGNQKKVMPQHTGWELWSGPTDPNPLIQDVILEGMLKGDSAYEGFKKHYPESTLTEEEYVSGPVNAVNDINAARERIERTEAAIKSSEQERERSEQAREASEQSRNTVEQERVKVESHRVIDEQGRVANEQSRVQGEQERAAAETGRIRAERERIAAEIAREQEEQIRIDNEQSRESAEKIREETVATATQKADTASTNADQQAARAKSLADHPPKIVTVDDTNYWAFWDEEANDYITSSVRSDGGPIFATFDIDPATMLLGVNYQPGYGHGSEFELKDDGHLYYEIND